MESDKTIKNIKKIKFFVVFVDFYDILKNIFYYNNYTNIHKFYNKIYTVIKYC